MRHRSGVAVLAAAFALLCVRPALADNYPVRDGSGAMQTFCSKLVSGLQFPCHLLYGLFGTTPTPVAVDGSGNVGVNVQSSALPAGAATNATVAETHATPGSDAAKAGAVQGVTGGKPVGMAAQIGAFVDGAIATLGTTTDAACGTDNGTCSLVALQKRTNQRLSSAITTLGSPAQDGSVTQLHADMTTGQVHVDLGALLTRLNALPTNVAQETGGNVAAAKADLDTIVTNTTGAATAANQATANTKLDTLHTDVTAGTTQATTNGGKLDTLHTDLTGGGQKTQVTQNASNVTATGTLTALNDAVSITPAGLAGLGLEVTGTNAGGVITPECLIGSNWQGINVIPLGGGPKATTMTAAGSWESIAGGVAQCRLRLSTAGSGSFGVTLLATNGSRLVRAFNTDPTNFYATITPNYPASGVTLPTDTVSSAAATTAFSNYISGREIYTGFAPTAFTGTCVFEVSLDGSGTSWWAEIVGAAGSTTSMNTVAFTGSSAPVFARTSPPEKPGLPSRWDCGVLNGSFSSGSVVIKNYQ